VSSLFFTLACGSIEMELGLLTHMYYVTSKMYTVHVYEV